MGGERLGKSAWRYRWALLSRAEEHINWHESAFHFNWDTLTRGAPPSACSKSHCGVIRALQKCKDHKHCVGPIHGGLLVSSFYIFQPHTLKVIFKYNMSRKQFIKKMVINLVLSLLLILLLVIKLKLWPLCCRADWAGCISFCIHRWKQGIVIST